MLGLSLSSSLVDSHMNPILWARGDDGLGHQRNLRKVQNCCSAWSVGGHRTAAQAGAATALAATAPTGGVLLQYVAMFSRVVFAHIANVGHGVRIVHLAGCQAQREALVDPDQGQLRGTVRMRYCLSDAWASHLSQLSLPTRRIHPSMNCYSDQFIVAPATKAPAAARSHRCLSTLAFSSCSEDHGAFPAINALPSIQAFHGAASTGLRCAATCITIAMLCARLGLFDGQLHADAVAAAVAEGRPLRHLDRADAQEPAKQLTTHVTRAARMGACPAGMDPDHGSPNTRQRWSRRRCAGTTRHSPGAL